MTYDAIYDAHYDRSRALIIGVNQYQHASPLDYACNDATAVASALKDKFEFSESNVTVLLDEDASKEKILSCFARFSGSDVGRDERIFVFFAGHGCTKSGKRGEIGFLVPYDGNVEDITSLIGWTEFIKISELVPAKHMFFVMDACYGGTAVQRYMSSGSMRFARDMLRRFTRQVLTAGKADEVVSDAGGPRAGHSVFTGHLLDGLEGAAGQSEGLITANSLMAYVYEKVAKDYQSRQTPHFGYLDGDGDMIFNTSFLTKLENTQQSENDVLVSIPENYSALGQMQEPEALGDRIKEYLSDTRFRIRLHDVVSQKIREALAETNVEKFPVQGMAASHEEVARRLRRYETAVSSLITVVTLLARWGDNAHRKVLEMVFSRLRDGHTSENGLNIYLAMQWYPMSLLAYVGGVAAVAAEDYRNLSAVLLAPSRDSTRDLEKPLIVPMVEGVLELDRLDAFKQLPGHDRYYFPRSEFMFKAVQPHLDDHLYLGQAYEHCFDRFEIFVALTYADQMHSEGNKTWGPLGRFGWKRKRHNDPLTLLMNEANGRKEKWAPLEAGFFGGSYARFEEVVRGFRKLVSSLTWH